MILQIALDVPLRRVFDYLLPAGIGASPAPAQLAPGIRVRVPFGRHRRVGILVRTSPDSPIDAAKLRCALELLDSQPVFDPVTFDVLCWAAEYYHHPIGEVMAAALPISLRSGQPSRETHRRWTLTAAGRRHLEDPLAKRAPRQRALLAFLAEYGGATAADLVEPFKPGHFNKLAERGWVAAEEASAKPAPFELRPSEVTLTDAQSQVVEAISATLGRFAAHLLYGVTGSGKTEVYLRVIAAALAGDGQVLVLVPEIALTPQLVDRFRRRFSSGVVVMHSALSGSLRRDAWRAARSGTARIIIGTRSAVFTSLQRLNLIVVDEEHDASYKQHEGFRYSARDLAVRRAQRAQVPIVLGSATPSLETLENVAQARYSRLVLPQRPGLAQAPRMVLIDLRKHAAVEGLSQPAMQAIGRHLADGGQVIVFLNRRGYAPSLFCSSCGWIASCEHCDARMTLHRRAAQLRCHHCGAHRPVPAACGQAAARLSIRSARAPSASKKHWPACFRRRRWRGWTAIRPRASGAMEAVLERVKSGEARILVGTQMLTKGHHFPDVSLVVILDADQGLFASDFRATERLAQTITQVAGRAGRAARPGEVMIQTSFPEHPSAHPFDHGRLRGLRGHRARGAACRALAALLASGGAAGRSQGQRGPWRISADCRRPRTSARGRCGERARPGDAP